MNRWMHAIGLWCALAAACQGQCLQWNQRNPANPPVGLDIQMVYDASRHVTVGILGYSEVPTQVRVREYDGANWILRPPLLNIAPAGERYSAGLVYDSQAHASLFFGGQIGVGAAATANNDLWTWNGLAWNQITPSSPWPPPTFNVRSAYDPLRNRAIFILSTATQVWQTWEWTGGGWERGPDLGPTGNPAQTTMAFDSWRGKAVVLSADTTLEWEATWEYTTGPSAAQGSWQGYLPSPNYPARTGALLVFDPYRGRTMRFFGRFPGLYSFLNDVHWWDPATHLWVQEDLSAFLPYEFRRGGGGIAFDLDRGVIVIHGGFKQEIIGGTGTPTNYQDTWEFTNNRPGILTNPAPHTVGCVGGSAILAVSVFGGPYDVQWYHENVAIPGATGLILNRTNLTPAHAGEYRVVISNACGSTASAPAQLEIRQPVQITSPPLFTHQACPGSSPIMIAPEVSGTLPIEIRLQRFDGEFWVNIPGQVGPPGHLFQVPTAQHSDTGLYRFAVSNSCNTVHSASGHLQVGVTFAEQPQAINAVPCQQVSMSVAAAGVGTLQYRWQHNGLNLSDDGRITGAQTSTLSILGARYEDEGSYRCIVTDSCESRASASAGLALPMPQWVQKSGIGPLRRAHYSDMAFDATRGVSVLYGGYGLRPNNTTGYLEDTWEWDGIEWLQRFPTGNLGIRSEHQMVWDAHRQSILLFGGSDGNTQQTSLWEYDGTSWTLLAATNPPPTGTSYSDATYDSARGKLIVLSTGSSGTWSNRTWEFDSATLAWSNIYTGAGPNPGFGPLVYSPSMGLTVGYYYWIQDPLAITYHFVNNAWVTSPTAGIHRQYQPSAAYDPVRRRVMFYGCCRGTSGGSTSETWGYDGGWSMVLPSFHTGEPIIPSVMTFDARRRAMVMAGNTYTQSFGTYALQTWEYRYLDRIHIDRQPVDAPLTPGGSATFRVHAAGAGTLSYQWRRNNQPLANGATPSGSQISGATSSELAISNLSSADAGTYTCTVTNACGGLTTEPVQLGSPCYANCDGSTIEPILNVADFGCFLSKFAAGDPYANCDNSTTPPVLNVADFGCFLSRFAAGCP